MATYEHDGAGFLVGKLVQLGGKQEQHAQEQISLLQDIRGILAEGSMGRTSRRSAPPGAGAALYLGAASASPGRARALATYSGSLGAGAGLGGLRQAEKVKAQEQDNAERKREQRKAQTLKRDARGKFIAGSGKAGSGGHEGDSPKDKAESSLLMGLAKRVGAGAVDMASGSRNIDPTLAAASEVKDALAPVGRGLSTVFSPLKNAEERRWKTRWLSRIYDRLKPKKAQDQGGGISVRSGGGLMSMGGSVLKALPFLLKRIFAPVAIAMAAWDLGKTFYEWLSGTEFGMKMLDGVDSFVKWSKDTFAGITESISAIPNRLGALFTSLDTAIRDIPVIGKAYSSAIDMANTAKTAIVETVSEVKAGYSNPTAAPAATVAGRVGQLASTGVTAAGTMASDGVKAVKSVAGKVSAKARAMWDGGAKDALVNAAHAANVDAGMVARVANLESGFDHNAKPVAKGARAAMNTVRQYDGTMAISSAHGYGQFIDGTWQTMVNKYGSKYGIQGAEKMNKEQANKLRDNKGLQAALLAEFTRENIERGRKMGGTDDNANVYAYHNLGSGDADRLMQAIKNNPSMSMRDALIGGRDVSEKELRRIDSVLKGNPAIYGNGKGTAIEAYQQMSRKMGAGDTFAAEAVAAQAKLRIPSVAVPSAGAGVSAPLSGGVPAMVSPAAIPKMEETRQAMPLNSTKGSSMTLNLNQDTTQNPTDRGIAQIVTGGMK